MPPSRIDFIKTLLWQTKEMNRNEKKEARREEAEEEGEEEGE